MLTSEQDLEGAGTCADTDVAIPVYHAVEGQTGVAGDTLVVRGLQMHTIVDELVSIRTPSSRS